MDMAMRAQGVKDMARAIERRLFSKVNNQVFMNQVLNTNGVLAVTHFDLVALVIYCVSFMRKYHDGAAVATLAPQAREAALMSRLSTPGLVTAYVRTVIRSFFSPVRKIMATARAQWYQGDELPMPFVENAPGYVEYTDNASSNPHFKGWRPQDDDPTSGFSNLLPGMSAANYVKSLGTPKMADEVASEVEDDAMYFVAGMAYKDEFGVTQFDKPDLEVATEAAVEAVTGGVTGLGIEHYSSDAYERTVGVVRVPQTKRPLSRAPVVTELTNKIIMEHSLLQDLAELEYEEFVTFNSDLDMSQYALAGRSDDVLTDAQDAISMIFPGSTVMVTDHFEADKHYGPLEINIKGVMLKLDLSKLEPLKPEKVFRPVIRTHIQPFVKNNLVDTLRTLEKRNLNTPADADPLDVEMLWSQAWSAALRVFYLPNTEEKLRSLPELYPDATHVREWVTRATPEKVKRLMTVEMFDFWHLHQGLKDNHFMLKPKLKPDMSASYATSVKTPQSIQYDPTAASIPVFSAIFCQVVERELDVLKPNVLIMQRKSPKQVIAFLNQFDWRPNDRGERYYLEGDYEQYDKSQDRTSGILHERKVTKFGVAAQYIKFFMEATCARSVSSLKAGVKAYLADQQGSGMPNTLLRNNDVNMLVIAQFLDKILNQIEFIMVMGDDITIAVRGIVDVAGWEVEINRKFNLNIKLSINQHGYFCSMDIVHLPGGNSTVVGDPLKRLLGLMQPSIKDEATFQEQYTSFVDSTDGIQYAAVQAYLTRAVPGRMQKVLPTLSSEAYYLVLRVLTAVRSDYEVFRKFRTQRPYLYTR
nr:MAG: RNA-dependent RNA polymerase [Aspergillus flavus virga-like virus 1]